MISSKSYTPPTVSPVPRSSSLLRLIVLSIAGVQTIAMAALLLMIVTSGHLTSGEALSRSIGWAALMIYGIPYAVFAAPALALALLNRWLPLALVLSLLAIPAAMLMFNLA